MHINTSLMPDIRFFFHQSQNILEKNVSFYLILNGNRQVESTFGLTQVLTFTVTKQQKITRMESKTERSNQVNAYFPRVHGTPNYSQNFVARLETSSAFRTPSVFDVEANGVPRLSTL